MTGADASGRGDILVLTRIWPSGERPSLGVFVRDRVRGAPGVRVIKPRSQRVPWPLLYADLLLAALRARGHVRGVEAHMLFPTGLVGWLVARLRGVPLVVYSHGRDVRGWEGFGQPRRWLTRFVAQRADRVVTNSEDTGRHVRAMGVEPVIAPPGVDIGRFRPSPRQGRRRVLYLGGRRREKGYEVARSLADAVLGPGLEELDPDAIPALIAQHDVVLVPSLAEGFGLVAVEAIASGRWVVANAAGGLMDIVVDGVNGTLVRDGDFAAALERVPDYDPFAIAATVERFSLAAWQAQMARVWDSLVP